MPQSQAKRIGSARLETDGDPIAGSEGTWRVTYTAGALGIASGGRLRITTDSDSDCGMPQLDDPASGDYTTVTAPSGVDAALLVLSHKQVDVVITGRALKPGEQLTVIFGDRGGGGPGARWQTFLENDHHVWVQVDASASGHPETLVDSPSLNILGGDIDHLVINAPSDAVTDQPFRVMVKAEDRWGNPAQLYRGRVRLSASGIALPEVELEFGPEHQGVRWLEGCTVTEPGVHRISAIDPDLDISARSNPVVCTQETPRFCLYWGDPHGGQVADARKVRDFFAYARDVAGIQFAGYQRNDPAMTKLDYKIQQDAEIEFYQPGRFVPLPGYEWSAGTSRGGHHNVYFRRFGQPTRRSGHAEGGPQGMPAVPGVSRDFDPPETELPHVLDLYRAFRGADLVLTPHVGGAHADLSYHEPLLEPAIEITSGHGTFEWFQREALERRYRVGFLGGSDCHTGRPGTDHPGHQERRFAKGGLTGLYCTDLTIEAWVAAMRARRCYATTGARIVTAIRADGHFMGEEYTTARNPEISVSVNATAPIEKSELFRDLDLIHSHDPGVRPNRRRLRILWTGASRKTSYSGVVWDGQLRVTGAHVTRVETLRFDSPRSGVDESTDRIVRWHSYACGYPSGLLVDLDSDEAEIQLVVSSASLSRAQFGGHGDSAPVANASRAPAETVRLELNTRDLRDAPRTVDIGILDRKIVVALAPQPGPEAAEFTFVDPTPKPGFNAYWARVQQQDLELAWTGPVFVDFSPPADAPG